MRGSHTGSTDGVGSSVGRPYPCRGDGLSRSKDIQTLSTSTETYMPLVKNVAMYKNNTYHEPQFEKLDLASWLLVEPTVMATLAGL